MGFKIDNLPKEKPSGSFDDIVLEDGIHDVVVEKCEYTQSTLGNNMLRVVFKTKKEGKFVFDQIMDDPTKQINAYRLGRLLAALKLDKISGELELKDLPKIIVKGRALRIAIVKKGNYTNIDIDKHQGYYPAETTAEATPEPTQKASTPDLKAPAEDDEFF